MMSDREENPYAIMKIIESIKEGRRMLHQMQKSWKTDSKIVKMRNAQLMSQTRFWIRENEFQLTQFPTLKRAFDKAEEEVQFI